MKPFFVLMICFVLGCILSFFARGFFDYPAAGRISLTVMLIFTAIGHFKFPKGMAMMLPSFIPARSFLIIATGILEIVLSVFMYIPSYQIITGWLLIIMFIVFLPANVYAAYRHLNYEKGTYDGNGFSYLWFRIPFQLLLIGWTYYFVIVKH